MTNINYKKVIRRDCILPMGTNKRYIKLYLFNQPMFIYHFLVKLNRFFYKSGEKIDKYIIRHSKTIKKLVKDFINE